jgi:hypothetical protein
MSSAERAVDDDFAQRGPENGELLIVEPLDEQFGHAGKVDRHRFFQACDAGAGQRDNHPRPSSATFARRTRSSSTNLATWRVNPEREMSQ